LPYVLVGMKLYKSIMKIKNRENVKFEIVRHTIFTTIMLIPLVISSAIEVYVSNNLFTWIIDFINI